MALVKCSECGQEISDMATACPKCGKPTGVQLKAEPKLKVEFSLWSIATFIIGGVLLIPVHLIVTKLSVAALESKIPEIVSLGAIASILLLLGSTAMVIFTISAAYYTFKALKNSKEVK